MVGHKRFKFQFEGYWEPNWFKTLILFAWIIIWPSHESITYRSRLLAFDQKGLYKVCNVGFGYWLRKKWICCRLKKCLRDFKTKDNKWFLLDLFFFFQKWFVLPPVSGLGFSLCFLRFCLVEHNHISCLYEKLKSFRSFRSSSFLFLTNHYFI